MPYLHYLLSVIAALFVFLVASLFFHVTFFQIALQLLPNLSVWWTPSIMFCLSAVMKGVDLLVRNRSATLTEMLNEFSMVNNLLWVEKKDRVFRGRMPKSVFSLSVFWLYVFDYMVMLIMALIALTVIFRDDLADRKSTSRAIDKQR